MWDPQTDVDAALNKYCTLVFGSANAKAVAEALLTIEASRDVETQVSKEMIANPVAGANRARRALAALAKVTLPQGHHSRLPSVTSPQEMLEELCGTLAVIIENAELCAHQLPALDALIKASKPDDAKARAAELQKKADAWFGTIAGGMEGFWLKETLQAKFAPARGIPFKDWFGFRTSNLAAFEEQGSQYVIGGEGKIPATALLKLQTPARHRAEFHFQCQVAETGTSRNGGLAFGSALDADELIRCQAYIRGRELRIRGQNLVSPATAEANLDPTQPLDCTVTIDLDQHRATFRVGEHSVTAELKESVRDLRFYGYVVENTRTEFGKIEVKHCE
jgi:hypothetical protein